MHIDWYNIVKVLCTYLQTVQFIYTNTQLFINMRIGLHHDVNTYMQIYVNI